MIYKFNDGFITIDNDFVIECDISNEGICCPREEDFIEVIQNAYDKDKDKMLHILTTSISTEDVYNDALDI